MIWSVPCAPPRPKETESRKQPSSRSRAFSCTSGRSSSLRRSGPPSIRGQSKSSSSKHSRSGESWATPRASPSRCSTSGSCTRCCGGTWLRELRTFARRCKLVHGLPDCDTWLHSEIHRHVGFDLLVRQERYDEALGHLSISLELRNSLEERGWAVGGLTALSAAARRAGLRDIAIEYARRALELARAERLLERHVTAAREAVEAAEQMPEEHAS